MKYIWHDGRWCEAIRIARPSVAPAIIRDGMAPALHPATGEMFDSKRAFSARTRELGYEEVGNDTSALFRRPAWDMRPVAADVKDAIDMLEAGHQVAPLDVAEPDTRIIT